MGNNNAMFLLKKIFQLVEDGACFSPPHENKMTEKEQTKWRIKNKQNGGRKQNDG